MSQKNYGFAYDQHILIPKEINKGRLQKSKIIRDY